MCVVFHFNAPLATFADAGDGEGGKPFRTISVHFFFSESNNFKHVEKSKMISLNMVIHTEKDTGSQRNIQDINI